MSTIDFVTICVTFGGIFVAAIVAYMRHLQYLRDLERERHAQDRTEAGISAT